MSGFFANFGMLGSSLAEHGVVPLLTFQWLCEHADPDGKVRDVRPKRIAAELSVIDAGLFTPAAVAEALEALQQPDPQSKRKECEGRRIVPLESEGCAFLLVTWDYYQNLWVSERRAMKNAARQRRFKASHRASGNTEVTHGNAEVTDDNDSLTLSKSESQSQSKKEEETPRAPKRTAHSRANTSEKKSRKDSPRDVALRSIVETIARTRPAFAQGVNYKALSKLCTAYGAEGLRAAAGSVEDWSRVEDPLPYLSGVCKKIVDRGANAPRTRQDTGLG
ncbi:MAG: hypothetical protein NDJ92_17525 [Thermoanaerobaculia bacterium]|nr:hypothetical protein [Thermoanaerobaculia bacterium]